MITEIKSKNVKVHTYPIQRMQNRKFLTKKWRKKMFGKEKMFNFGVSHLK